MTETKLVSWSIRSDFGRDRRLGPLKIGLLGKRRAAMALRHRSVRKPIQLSSANLGMVHQADVQGQCAKG